MGLADAEKNTCLQNGIHMFMQCFQSLLIYFHIFFLGICGMETGWVQNS